PVTITMNPFLNCYCSSSPGNAADDDIFEVVFNGNTNTSNCNTNAPGPGSVIHRYSNYYPLGNFSTVEQGTTVNFSVLVDDCDLSPFYSFGSAIWIDFNHNGSFSDAGEQVFVEANTNNAPRTVSGTITIPCTAMLGQTAMRIIEASGYSGSGLIPCLNYGFGETEDYLINIVPKTGNIGFDLGPTTAPTANATSGTPVSNLSISAIGQGNNANTNQTTLLINATNPSNYTNASAQNNAGIVARNRNLQLTDTSAYFSVTLTPASGYQVVLDSVYFGTYSTATGPTTLEIRTSKDNYAGIAAQMNVSANSVWSYLSNAVVPVVSNTPLTVRIYGYVNGGNGSVTTGNTNVNWRIDDLKLKCTIKCLSSCNTLVNCSNTPIACYGGSSTITATPTNTTGQVFYKLNNGVPQLSNTFSGISAGNYTVTATDGNGCTATTLVIVSQPPLASSYTNATACNSFLWTVNNTTYTTSGIYTSTGTTPSGCPKSDTLNLTVNYSSTLPPLTITACNSYTWNGGTYTLSGTYTGTALNSYGCVSSQTLNLTIIPASVQVTQTACDSYTWPLNNTTYTQTGTYTYVNGCQTTTLNLTIINSTNSSASVTACGNYVWTVNNTNYTSSGTYTSVNGCHTSVLNLTIIPTTSQTNTITACDTYTWNINNVTYTQSGTYTAVNGCHTDILNLTINYSTTSNSTITACDSYTWHGTTYTTSGTYTFTSLNTAGCLNTENLNLTVNYSSSSSSSVSACDSYLWHNTTYTTSGTYTFTSLNAAGCTHTETLNLVVNYSTTSSTAVTACDSYTWTVSGNTYTQSGTYTKTSLNAAGCVHTAILNLVINSSTTSTTSITACNSYTWHGTTYTTSGTYTFTSLNTA
ncbi:MAG TPA: GEVED domain-containing protein, partial [Chitinophagaceae bacterium]|nr:GEVED domain-containing protein [Chitinophagaceae bacterium]